MARSRFGSPMPPGRTMFAGIGQCAGVEVHGAIDRLLATSGR